MIKEWVVSLSDSSVVQLGHRPQIRTVGQTAMQVYWWAAVSLPESQSQKHSQFQPNSETEHRNVTQFRSSIVKRRSPFMTVTRWHLPTEMASKSLCKWHHSRHKTVHNIPWQSLTCTKAWQSSNYLISACVKNQNEAQWPPRPTHTTTAHLNTAVVLTTKVASLWTCFNAAQAQMTTTFSLPKRIKESHHNLIKVQIQAKTHSHET